GATYVRETVGVGESEVGVEAGAEVVAIEPDGHAALLVEDALDAGSDGGFAGARKAAEPEDDPALAEELLFVGKGQRGVGVDVVVDGLVHGPAVGERVRLQHPAGWRRMPAGKGREP